MEPVEVATYLGVNRRAGRVVGIPTNQGHRCLNASSPCSVPCSPSPSWPSGLPLRWPTPGRRPPLQAAAVATTTGTTTAPHTPGGGTAGGATTTTATTGTGGATAVVPSTETRVTAATD